MGIAIRVPDVDFSGLGLGRVSIGEIPVTALTIIGNSVITGESETFSVAYTPTDTTQLGVTWSIVSGGQYASINANSGVLTVLPGASNSSVRIKVVSSVNSSIQATKDITVTYATAFDVQLADASTMLTRNTAHTDATYAGTPANAPTMRLQTSTTRLFVLASRSVSPDNNYTFVGGTMYTDCDAETEAVKTLIKIPATAKGVRLQMTKTGYKLSAAVVRNVNNLANFAWFITKNSSGRAGWTAAGVATHEARFGEFTAEANVAGFPTYTVPQNSGDMFLYVAIAKSNDSALTAASLSTLGVNISLIY